MCASVGCGGLSNSTQVGKKYFGWVDTFRVSSDTGNNFFKALLTLLVPCRYNSRDYRFYTCLSVHLSVRLSVSSSTKFEDGCCRPIFLWLMPVELSHFKGFYSFPDFFPRNVCSYCIKTLYMVLYMYLWLTDQV
jgi:hypothetical protein